MTHEPGCMVQIDACSKCDAPIGTPCPDSCPGYDDQCRYCRGDR